MKRLSNMQKEDMAHLMHETLEQLIVICRNMQTMMTVCGVSTSKNPDLKQAELNIKAASTHFRTIFQMQPQDLEQWNGDVFGELVKFITAVKQKEVRL